MGMRVGYMLCVQLILVIVGAVMGAVSNIDFPSPGLSNQLMGIIQRQLCLRRCS